MKLVFFQVLGLVLAGDHPERSPGEYTSLIQATNIRPEHSLLQASSLIHSTDGSEGKSKKRREYVNKMFQTAQDLLKEKITDTVAAFVNDVLETMELTVVPAIHDAHDQDQQMLNEMWAHVDASMVSAATYMEAINGFATTAQSASSNHVTCRSEEATHCIIIAECETRLAAALQVFNDAEQEVEEIQEGISADWCGSSVDKMELAFRNAARPRLRHYLTAEEAADAARNAYLAIQEECAAAHAAQQEKRGMCNEAQQALETSTCTWATTAEQARREVSEAYHAAIDGYNIVVHNAESQEADRKVEFSTLQITECLLRQIHVAASTEEPCDESTITPPEVVEEQLQACHELVVDTSELDLTYNTPPGLPELPGVPVFPCAADFTTAQYGEMAQTNMCAGPAVCNSCQALAEHITVDGCHTAGDSHDREVRDATDTANVRCCSFDGSSCETQGLHSGCQQDKTFFEAQTICADNGMRLCSEAEMDSSLCCGTGCGYDSSKVWTSTDSVPAFLLD